MTEEETENFRLSHEDLCEVTTSTLCTLIRTDPLLDDLPPDIALEEVLLKIAVEHGQSITLILERDREPPIKVIVPQKNTTVLALKKSIRKHFEMYQKRTKNRVLISWKYIWKTYLLECEGSILDDDHASLSNYGVKNKSVIKFKRKRNKKYNQR